MRQRREVTAARRSRRVPPGTAIGFAALVLAMGGGAYAAIPDSEGVIAACHKAGDGSLRVIDAEAGETCRQNETRLSWNYEGEPGPIGAPGPEGPAGPEGPQGEPGGLSGHEIVQSPVATVKPDDPFVVGPRAACPEEKVVTGGGYNVFEGERFLDVVGLVPVSTSSVQAFDVHLARPEGEVRLISYAICVDRGG